MARIALVTGANQGIGYGLVQRLCKENLTWVVYGTSRSKKNGDEAVVKLHEEGLSNAKFLEVDLTNEKTITELKNYFIKEHQGLDVLVNNAGMAFKPASTESRAVKVEVTLATNVFGTAAVCRELFPILRDGARVVLLSGMVAPMALHKIKKLDAERYAAYTKSDPPMTEAEILASMTEYVSAVKDGSFAEKKWPNDAAAYSISKMADTILARAYQHEFSAAPARDIICNAADPGYVSTNMSSFKGHLTVDEGADTPYYLATLPPNSEVKGQHVAKREVVPWN